VVFEIAVAAVHDRVVRLQVTRELGHSLLGRIASREHDPDGARWSETADQPRQRLSTRRAAARDVSDGVGIAVPDDDVVTAADEPTRHVAAHAAESNKS